MCMVFLKHVPTKGLEGSWVAQESATQAQPPVSASPALTAEHRLAPCNPSPGEAALENPCLASPT